MKFRHWHPALGALGVLVFILSAQFHAAGQSRPRYKAVAFDYLVIFDANSVASEVEKVFPGKSREFVSVWRNKQFEYCFLRSITDSYEDFYKVTGDALDFTATQMHLQLTPDSRQQLLNAYMHLTPWPDAISGLKQLKAAGVRIITISNFTPTMLRANADNAGISDLFDELVSTDVNHTFKPDPRAYQLGIDHLQLRKDEIVFAAFGSWDAYGATRFGFTTVWVNRFNLPAERLGAVPDRTTNNMQDLVEFVLGNVAP